ncbi:SDR family oxidoreductase [Terricaulis silvestris]|uniref:D-xylose 1-dehydrogenase n=1 Tax=Terricaulis silvestris TaxID=2686094 RepID=A0A6I6MLQ4_9CAUL|nr:SDR family oxidoreductase [Terricaulis silvestris]QGZ94941.1 2-(S)-hydroxypropyl-CoM dehydrogenase [Terricaulis silvestris]
MKRLKGKTAIVTGAAQGIGRAIAQCFVTEGARVALVDINTKRGREAADELAASGAQVCFVEVDVADPASVNTMVAEVVKQLGPPNLLVNNAGIAVFRDPLETSVEDWRHCFAVDTDGVWHCSRAVLPHLLELGKGDIINIASVHASQIIPKCFPYPVAKHAVVGLTRALAIEYADRNIRVNAISPGYIGTEIVEKIFADAPDPEKMRAETDALHPVKRIGRPEEIGWAAVFLASDEARFLTAQNIVIDGGRSVVFHQ